MIHYFSKKNKLKAFKAKDLLILWFVVETEELHRWSGIEEASVKYQFQFYKMEFSICYYGENLKLYIV